MPCKDETAQHVKAGKRCQCISEGLFPDYVLTHRIHSGYPYNLQMEVGGIQIVLPPPSKLSLENRIFPALKLQIAKKTQLAPFGMMLLLFTKHHRRNTAIYRVNIKKQGRALPQWANHLNYCTASNGVCDTTAGEWYKSIPTLLAPF